MGKSEKTGSDELGGLIRTRRQALGLRRRDLVDLTGLSYPFISQIETGYRLPSERALRDLADALQLDLGELAAALPADKQLAVSRLPMSSPPVSQSWHTNPSYVSERDALAVGTATPSSRTGIVAAAVELLEQLPPDDRLDALSQVQRELLEGLVSESRTPRRRS